ncbi:MAG: nickel-dependent hydrogenase large subunit, partial [bacterium]
VQSFPQLKTLGVGGEDFLCAGTLGDETGPDASLFPKGVWLEKALETLQPQVSESIHRSFYRVPLSKPRRGNVVELAPGKAGAYSWIKSPRYLGNAMEVGPVARLVIAGMAGSRSHTAQVAELLNKRLGLSLAQANSAGGRILATLGELGPLFRWCGKILDDLKPGEPSAAPGAGGAVTGQGLGAVEGPAGAVMHHVVVERGRITHYDIISPSTWNGGPRDLDNQPSGVELALSRKPPRLSTAKGRLAASRIVHSFYFSARDAVH